MDWPWTPVKVGIAGPVNCREFKHLLRNESGLPEGMGGTAVTALVHALLGAGHEVSVYTLDPTVSADRLFYGERLKLYVGAYRARPRARALDGFRQERRTIARFVKSDVVDVVNAHWSYEYALGALASRPDTIVTVRDWAPLIFRMQPDPYRLIRLLMDRQCLRTARNFTVASPYMMSLLADRRLSATLTPNMIAAVATRARQRTSRLGRRLICVGHGLNGRKNVWALLRAMKHLEDCELYVVGNTYDVGDEAASWVEHEGLRDRVLFAGPLDHAATVAAIGASDVLVHPSLEESFGNVLVEAMAQGIPVVGGVQSGAVPWVLDQGQAGMLVDVRDPKAIAAAVHLILDDDETWCSLSRAGRTRVEAVFGERAVLEAYCQAYQMAIADGND